MQEKSRARAILGMAIRLLLLTFCLLLMTAPMKLEAIDWNCWPAADYEVSTATVSGVRIEPGVTRLQFTENGRVIYSFPVSSERVWPYLVNDGLIFAVDDSFDGLEMPGLPADGQYNEPLAATESATIHACLQAPRYDTDAWKLSEGATVMVLADLHSIRTRVLLMLMMPMINYTPLNFDCACFAMMIALSTVSVALLLSICSRLKERWSGLKNN